MFLERAACHVQGLVQEVRSDEAVVAVVAVAALPVMLPVMVLLKVFAPVQVLLLGSKDPAAESIDESSAVKLSSNSCAVN